jgi:signal transduction histidine kinase
VRAESEPAQAVKLIAAAETELDAALEELRELARGLHPGTLTFGLGPALEALVVRVPFPVTVEGVPEQRLPEQVEATVYYVIAEALTNAAKHSGASRGDVSVAAADGTVSVEVADDGRGGAALGRGSGIQGLADRVEALGGELEIVSPVGAGTVVRATVPLT